MAELRGKGWRVLGYFVWMLGAGIILDAGAPWLARLLLVLGAALFVAGVVQERQHVEVPE